jgi:RNA 3'-terminal phosphate cyclase (ATP)
VLAPLLTASRPSQLTLQGGTHNPLAPPFDFFARCLAPLLRRMGPGVVAHLERPGFYPAGGGSLRVEIAPVERLQGFALQERGELVARRGRILLSNLPAHIGEREAALVCRATGWEIGCIEIEVLAGQPGPGNVVMLEVENTEVSEIVTGFGERGVPAESVAGAAVDALRRYLAAGAAVGEHLADQLLLPLALAGGGSFTAAPLNRHATTQIDLIQRFLDIPIRVAPESATRVVVELG